MHFQLLTGWHIKWLNYRKQPKTDRRCGVRLMKLVASIYLTSHCMRGSACQAPKYEDRSAVSDERVECARGFPVFSLPMVGRFGVLWDSIFKFHMPVFSCNCFVCVLLTFASEYFRCFSCVLFYTRSFLCTFILCLRTFLRALHALLTTACFAYICSQGIRKDLRWVLCVGWKLALNKKSNRKLTNILMK